MEDWVPQYGNYGGPGHGDPTYNTPPIDQMDEYFRQHDKDWADGRGGQGDKDLYEKLKNLPRDPRKWSPPAPDPKKADKYRKKAQTYFMGKKGKKGTFLFFRPPPKLAQLPTTIASRPKSSIPNLTLSTLAPEPAVSVPTPTTVERPRVWLGGNGTCEAAVDPVLITGGQLVLPIRDIDIPSRGKEGGLFLRFERRKRGRFYFLKILC